MHTIPNSPAGCKGEAQQCVERVRGAATTTHLHLMAKEHKGNKHSGSIVADIDRWSEQGGEDTEEVGDQHAQARQHVPVQRASCFVARRNCTPL
jgi:hypothetical protein